jgi:hypothetical protein
VISKWLLIIGMAFCIANITLVAVCVVDRYYVSALFNGVVAVWLWYEIYDCKGE